MFVCFVLFLSQLVEQVWSGKLSTVCGFPFGVYNFIGAPFCFHRASGSAENPSPKMFTVM